MNQINKTEIEFCHLATMAMAWITYTRTGMALNMFLIITFSVINEF